MSGFSGSSVAGHTKLAFHGTNAYAISDAQWRLLRAALADGGMVFVEKAWVRSARILVSLRLGALTDDGALGPSPRSNADGERWTFKVADGVTVRP